MKKIVQLIILCFPLFFCECCGDPIPYTAKIYGTVIDNDTQKPIDGVQITLMPGVKNKYTGGDGYYEFDDLDAPQQYILSVQKEGYHPDRKSVNLNPGQKEGITFALNKE